MSRIAALNDEEPTQLSTGEIQPVITREAQEDAAYQQYTEALRLQAAGDDDGADVLFRAVLASPALADTAEPDTSGMARLLRYTCHKNLGSGALRRGQHETALAGLLTAAAIDDSDVTLWYKVGVAAYRCGRYHQARSAFKQGLACSPGHWPCMDSLVSVLYLLNDFEECVLRLSAAFRRDPQYTRGRALVDLMLKEQPSLRGTMRPFLPDGDSTLSGREYDPAAGERLTKEAVTLRTQRREQQRRPRPLAPLSLSRPPAAASWEEVGRSLLHLYKHVTDGGAALSLLSRIELEPTLARLQRGEAASPPPPPPPDGEQQEPRSGRAAGRHVTFQDEESVRRRLDLDGTAGGESGNDRGKAKGSGDVSVTSRSEDVGKDTTVMAMETDPEASGGESGNDKGTDSGQKIERSSDERAAERSESVGKEATGGSETGNDRGAENDRTAEPSSDEPPGEGVSKDRTVEVPEAMETDRGAGGDAVESGDVVTAVTKAEGSAATSASVETSAETPAEDLCASDSKVVDSERVESENDISAVSDVKRRGSGAELMDTDDHSEFGDADRTKEAPVSDGDQVASAEPEIRPTPAEGPRTVATSPEPVRSDNPATASDIGDVGDDVDMKETTETCPDNAGVLKNDKELVDPSEESKRDAKETLEGGDRPKLEESSEVKPESTDSGMTSKQACGDASVEPSVQVLEQETVCAEDVTEPDVKSDRNTPTTDVPTQSADVKHEITGVPSASEKNSSPNAVHETSEVAAVTDSDHQAGSPKTNEPAVTRQDDAAGSGAAAETENPSPGAVLHVKSQDGGSETPSADRSTLVFSTPRPILCDYDASSDDSTAEASELVRPPPSPPPLPPPPPPPPRETDASQKPVSASRESTSDNADVTGSSHSPPPSGVSFDESWHSAFTATSALRRSTCSDPEEGEIRSDSGSADEDAESPGRRPSRDDRSGEQSQLDVSVRDIPLPSSPPPLPPGSPPAPPPPPPPPLPKTTTRRVSSYEEGELTDSDADSDRGDRSRKVSEETAEYRDSLTADPQRAVKVELSDVQRSTDASGHGRSVGGDGIATSSHSEPSVAAPESDEGKSDPSATVVKSSADRPRRSGLLAKLKGFRIGRDSKDGRRVLSPGPDQAGSPSGQRVATPESPLLSSPAGELSRSPAAQSVGSPAPQFIASPAAQSVASPATHKEVESSVCSTDASSAFERTAKDDSVGAGEDGTMSSEVRTEAETPSTPLGKDKPLVINPQAGKTEEVQTDVGVSATAPVRRVLPRRKARSLKEAISVPKTGKEVKASDITAAKNAKCVVRIAADERRAAEKALHSNTKLSIKELFSKPNREERKRDFGLALSVNRDQDQKLAPSPLLSETVAQKAQTHEVDSPEAQVAENVLKAEVPEADTPKVQVPEAYSPKAQVSVALSPKAPVSEAHSPKIQVSEAHSPKTHATEGDALQAQVPETDAPKMQAPEADAPKMQVPEADFSKEADAPQAPEADAPKEQVPKTESPKEHFPEADDPKVEKSETHDPKLEPQTESVADETQPENDSDQPNDHSDAEVIVDSSNANDKTPPMDTDRPVEVRGDGAEAEKQSPTSPQDEGDDSVQMSPETGPSQDNVTQSLESSVYEEENPLPLGAGEDVLSEEKMVEGSPGMDPEHTKRQKEETSIAIDQDVDMSVDCADQEMSLGEIDDPGSDVKDKEQQDQEPEFKNSATVDKADDKVEENKMDDDVDGAPQSEHREGPDGADLKHQADQDKNGCGDSVEERNPSDESTVKERKPSEEAADKPQTDMKTTISSDKEGGEHRDISGESGEDCTAAVSGDQEKRQVSAESEQRAESEKRADSAEERRGTSTDEGEKDVRGSEESSGEERGAESGRRDQPDPTDDSCAGAETAGSAQASDTGAESEPATPAPGRRRGGKRKRNILDSLKMWPRNDPAEKRRSKRSRTAGGLRYEEPAGGDEVANHRETFSALIPAALRYDRSSMKIGEASPRRKAADLAGDGGDQPVPLSEDERDAVLAWVAAHAENGGAVRLLWAYLDMLETLRDRRWPSGLAELFTELYELARPHVSRPEPFELEVTADSAPALRRQVLLALLYAELRVDCSLADGGGTEGLQLAEEELSWLGFLVHREDLLEKEQPATLLRFGWCSSKLCRLQGDAPLAMAQLRELEQWYERAPAERRPTVRLANAATERLISQQSVQRQLASLQRVHDLGSLQRLYDQQRLEDVVEVLADTFGGSGSAVKLPQPTAGGEPLPHRSRQLLMMVDALQRLERPRGELAAYAESCLHEALQSYLALDEPAERTCWADALLGVLAALQACLERGDDWMETLEPPRRCRLTENLLHLTVHQLNCADAIILPLETVTPWLLLHHAIATAERSASGSGPAGGGRPRTMPAALRFLVEAHEALGARSWCCTDGGALLLRSVDHLLPALDAADDLPYDEQLRRELEQCFFCLYGHPERRRAARDLQDHGVPPVTLTWPRAQLLYYYFCPCELPRFDSYRDLSISADDEALFQRVMALVPEESSPDRLWRALEEFVTAPEEQRPPPPAVLPATSVTKNLYYLVADFRFKNRQWETIAPQLESLEFYARDLCINPERRDSWAAMALTRASEVGRELNLCRRPSEDAPELWSRVEAAVRCYQRALELDPSTHDLWLEFGTFSYMLNSHANRLLRQESSGDLDLATFGRLEAIAARMAGQAAECFQRAEEVAVEQAAIEDGEFYDDRWLHHYMLGKIASKDDQPVQRVLAHYQKAQELLRDAECPRKINYQSPPHQALEALEVYYRTHATVLKYLLQHEQQPLDGEVRRAIVWHLDAMEQSALPIKPQNEREGELKRKRDPSCSDDPVEVKRLKLDEAAATCAVTLSHKILASAVSEARARLSGLHPPSEQEGPGAASTTPAPASTEERPPPAAEGTEQRPTLAAAEGTAPASAVADNQSTSTPTTAGTTGAVSTAAALSASGGSTTAAPTAAASSTAAGAVSDDDVVLLSDDSRPAAPAAPAAKEEEPDPGHRRLVARCVEALHHVIKRFPEHYKSVYRLAHYYYTSKTNRHLDWARDLLLGCADWQAKSHMPTFGLFAERKPNNFFHGIWRIPIEDIDRPGSFAAHMYRSVSLLADVLRAADDFRTLLQLSDWLRPMPDDDKKYLRDAEREQLAGHAFNMGLQCARATFRRLFKAQSPVSGTRRLYFLLGLYETHAGMRPRRRPKIARLLEETYKLFRGGKVESEPPLLQQAISYCRSQVNAIQQAKMQSAPGGPAPVARGSGGVTRGTGRRGRPPLSGSRGRGRPPGSATAITGGRLPSMQDQLRQLQAAVEAERLRQLQQVWADQLGSRATSVQADVEANYRRLLQLQRAGQPASEQSKPAQTPAKPAQTPAIPAQVTVEPVQTPPKSTAEASTKAPSQTVPQPAVSTATKPATSTSKPPAPAAKQPVSAPAPMPARSAPETTAASRTLVQAASGGADLSVLAALSHAGLTITTVSQESPPPSVTPAQSRPTPPPPQQAAKPRFSDAFRPEVSQAATVPAPARSQPQTTAAAPTRPPSQTAVAASTRPQPPQPQTTTKPQPQQTSKPQPPQTAKPQPQATSKPQSQPTSKPQAQATAKPQSQAAAKPQPQPTSKSQSTSKPLPQASAKPRFSDAFRGTESGQQQPAALPALPKSLTVKEVSVPTSSASVAASAVASAATGRTSDSVRVSVSPVPPKDGRAAAETLRAVKATPGMTITPTSGGSKAPPPAAETRPSTKAGSTSVATVTPTKPPASASAVSRTPEKAVAPSERLPSEVSVSVSAGGGSVSITPLSTSRPAVTTAAETPSVSLTPAVPRPQPRPVARDRPRPRPTATATALLRQYRSRPAPPPLPRLPSGMTVTPSRAPAPALPSHISITPVSAAPRPAPIPAELARAAAGGLSITPVVPPVRLVSRPRLAAPSGPPRPPPPPRQSSQRPARQPAVRQPVVALQKLPPSVLPSRPAGAPTQRAGPQRPVAGSARPAHSSAGPQRPVAGAARPAHSSSTSWPQRAPPAAAAAPARNRPSFSAALPRQRPAVDMGQLPASISVTPVVVPAQPAKPKPAGGSDDDVICID